MISSVHLLNSRLFTRCHRHLHLHLHLSHSSPIILCVCGCGRGWIDFGSLLIVLSLKSLLMPWYAIAVSCPPLSCLHLFSSCETFISSLIKFVCVFFFFHIYPKLGISRFKLIFILNFI